MKYTLRCFAIDGESVREGEFPTKQAAWDRSNDMGSRWFFYPVHFVFGPKRCVAAPDEFAECEGMTVPEISAHLAANQEFTVAILS